MTVLPAQRQELGRPVPRGDPAWLLDDGNQHGQMGKDQRQQPVRLLITCRREGYSPWFVLLEIRPGYTRPPGCA